MYAWKFSVRPKISHWLPDRGRTCKSGPWYYCFTHILPWSLSTIAPEGGKLRKYRDFDPTVTLDGFCPVLGLGRLKTVTVALLSWPVV